MPSSACKKKDRRLGAAHGIRKERDPALAKANGAHLGNAFASRLLSFCDAHAPPLFLALCFFFNDTATTAIYTLSLHDALPILWMRRSGRSSGRASSLPTSSLRRSRMSPDRKSTRLNSSHTVISYAVFCLK